MVCQKYIYKIHSARLRKAKWKLTLPLAEARANDEVISLADSQVLRWLDELNGITDADKTAKEIKAQIKRLKKEPNTVQLKREIRGLYAKLDEVQFKPDYMCLIIDKKRDYYRACEGFSINGIRYKRLLGTNGGVKNETIVFVSERHIDEIRRRIDNGRDLSKEMVPAKLEAYKALACSASIPVSIPDGILVVPDCETKFIEDIIYLNDEGCEEPLMESRSGVTVDLDESDGYGLMSPTLAQRWSDELDLGYLVSGVNTRFSWEKGMIFTFDFHDFAERVAGNYMVKDAWGNEVDIRNIDLILTTSMLKLWDSYESCDHYIACCKENGYTFGIAKTCPQELEREHTLNYQFIQSYHLDDDDIEELIAPTMNEIRDVLCGDISKTILFLKGMGLNERNILRQEDDYTKAIMIDERMVHDPYVQSNIFRMIKNRINEAKVGVLKVHGNYSMICGDPYSLCQSIFGLPVTGLLKAGEIYNQYWRDQESDALACFRAPMTCHGNIRIVKPNRSEEASYWFRYMQTCTLLNSWDSAAHALNGADKDGDLVMLTDNDVLVRKHRQTPVLMCVQRKARKKLVTEEDAVESNIASFGDDIGKTTNWITSMFEVQSKYPEDSPEYGELEYRIMCGQLFQQNAIDKAKGIIAQPMPRSWHDRHAVGQIEDPAKREFYTSIVADKKPYFMRLIYPDLMRQYNTYIKNTNKNAMREFSLSVDQLLQIPETGLTERQAEFLKYYHQRMPVGTGDCVMNKICRRFEEEFDGYIGAHNRTYPFDYTIMKSGVEYTPSMYNCIHRLYDDYSKRIRSYAVFASYERVDEYDSYFKMQEIREDFIRECAKACPNKKVLCDIVLDICYTRTASKRFAWDICGSEIIHNLLAKNNEMIYYPVRNDDGGITYCGERFSVVCQKIGEEE